MGDQTTLISRLYRLFALCRCALTAWRDRPRCRCGNACASRRITPHGSRSMAVLCWIPTVGAARVVGEHFGDNGHDCCIDRKGERKEERGKNREASHTGQIAFNCRKSQLREM